MCGIVGLYNWSLERKELTERLHQMCRAIVHRGPDDEGIFVDSQIGLGMRRLSIIDVEGGHQPIHNEDGTVTVVFNGEIYNFRELRETLQQQGHTFKTRTDTEVIVHAYEEYGVECVSLFNGIFSFAVWDGKRKRLVLARDRMGVKPLYFMEKNNGLIFASEIKALLTIPTVPRTLDIDAAAQFFRLGFVPSPHTLFQSVHKIPAGWRLVIEDGQIRQEQYWDFRFDDTSRTYTFEESREELQGLLRQAVGNQLVSDVPLGAFLSGGVDSSGVVAFMQQAASRGVQTYSIGFEGQHAYHNEAPYAEAVAKKLGTRHKTIIAQPKIVDLMPTLIERLDEPLTDTSFLVTYLVSEFARRDVKVVLSGVGADELFGGYRRYLSPLFQKITEPIPVGWRQRLGQGLAHKVKADRGTVLGNLSRYVKALGRNIHLPPGDQYLNLISVFSPDLLSSLFEEHRIDQEVGSIFVDLYDRAPARTPLERLMYVDIKTVLPESLLLLTDKMGMAAALEVRVPFLDNQIVDFVSRIPSSFHVRGFALKRLLKAALKGIVPDMVLTRSKRGFGTPMSSWLRTDLQEMTGDLLGSQRVRREGLLNPAVVSGMLQDHYDGKEDYTEPLMGLLGFQLWREQFGVALG